MTEPRGKPDAILHPSDAEQAIEVERREPSPELAPFADYLWFVGWRTDEPHHQVVVPQPRVQLAPEVWEGVPRLLVHGVTRQLFHRTLVGTGHTLGVAFHPGGFRPFLDRGVGSLIDTVSPAADVLGIDDRAVAEAMLGTQDRVQMAAELEGVLLGLDPQPDPVADEVRELVASAEEDRGLRRAEDLAERSGRSLRSLQRLFDDYVGIGPKWVISRFRILDAAAAAHSGERVNWAALAVELGFTDQAHLTRAFTAVVGTPPATYEREA